MTHNRIDRRHFLGAAAMTMTAARLCASPAVRAQSHPVSTFGVLKQIDAGVLNVEYGDVGSADDPVAVLLHGWPYDIHSYVEVAPLLASAGYRVIVPYLRGYGTTRFLSSDTLPNGQQATWHPTSSR